VAWLRSAWVRRTRLRAAMAREGRAAVMALPWDGRHRHIDAGTGLPRTGVSAMQLQFAFYAKCK
jgi:hypothetical protein